MGFLHILQSESSGRYYIGSTNDLKRRLSEHRRDHTHAREDPSTVRQRVAQARTTPLQRASLDRS